MIHQRAAAAFVGAAILQIVLRAFHIPEVFYADVHGVAAYLGVIGGLYSIVVAFLIYVVWEQFNRVQVGMGTEASALEDLIRIAAFLSERNNVLSVQGAVRQYMEATAGDEAPRLAMGNTSELAEERFDSMCQAVRGIEVNDPKDQVIYGELLRALTRVNDARDDRLSVSTTRIPPTLWSLVVFASCVLFAGFLVLGIQSFVLSVGISATVAGTLAFLLSVIQDMDNPFDGVWNVSYAEMKTVAARIGQK
jgi:hypothetical protein